jgi:small-conductance mechanosensitive channel
MENDYENFDTRHAKEAYLVYADGDVPKDKFTKFYHYLLNVSIITRWFLFIVPVLGILWIPGILSITIFPNANIWGTKLLWWSIWLSVGWVGWWASLAASRILHEIGKSTIAVIAVDTRRYVNWIQALHRHIAFFGWSIAIWVSWTPLISYREDTVPGDGSARAIGLVGRILFALLVCSGILLCEKVAIQWIAQKFHEQSYADRIEHQRFAVRTIVALYRNSSDIPGCPNTFDAGQAKTPSVDPRQLLKHAKDSFRKAATTATTALGTVVSEIAGSAILQPNSPQAVVKTALQSANKSRLLARRLFYSFKKPGSESLYVTDIAPFFTSLEEANRAFALFDKDDNGDISKEELEMECLEVHREQLSLEHSMRDLDSAVGKLDNILMSIYSIVALVVMAVALEAQLVTLITGTGSLVLGLSWLIGASMQEILASIIFLFVKHPYDVGDKVLINKEFYTVQEINLLSTIFIDSNSAFVQAPNGILNTLWIQNIRRSKEMSEPFTFDVAYTTTFSDLEKFRDKMLNFLQKEKRHFQPIFDITIQDFPDQTMMTLCTSINYKSNFQQDSLRVKRRNKWLCALKAILAEVKIYGPKGDPDALPPPKRCTQIPWDLVKEEDEQAAQKKASDEHEDAFGGVEWRLSGRNASILNSADEVFGEAAMLHTSPRQGLCREQMMAGPSTRPPPVEIK